MFMCVRKGEREGELWSEGVKGGGGAGGRETGGRDFAGGRKRNCL